MHHHTVIDGKEVYGPAPHNNIFVINCHYRNNSLCVSDVFSLTDIREVVDLVLKFGEEMCHDLNCDNSLEICDTFYLNNFADKETFHVILSYQ